LRGVSNDDDLAKFIVFPEVNTDHPGFDRKGDDLERRHGLEFRGIEHCTE